jgi:hypothetical protein
MQELALFEQLPRQTVMLCGLRHFEAQIVRLPRLSHIREQSPLVDGANHCREVGVARDHDARGGSAICELRNQLIARHTRHALIGHHDCEPRFVLDDVERLLSRLRFDHHELVCQDVFERHQHLGLVVDQQHYVFGALHVQHLNHSFAQLLVIPSAGNATLPTYRHRRAPRARWYPHAFARLNV